MKKGLLLIAAIIFIAFNSNAQLATETFDSGLPTGWQTVTPTFASFNTNWHGSDHEGSFFMRASSYSGGNHATEQWLVSSSFSTVGYTSLSLTFDNDKANYPGNDLQVFVSSNFAGDSASFSSATWVEVTGLNLSSGDYTVVTSTSDISSVVGNDNVYVAFKYTSTDSEGAVWDVDNVQVTGVASVNNIKTSTKLFPNPASSILNIKSEVNISNITVSNVIGQRVLTVNSINSNNYKLNVENLNNGVYLININNVDGTSGVAKFVKK